MIHERDRCERCGWPYSEDACDCHRGNCSRRPLPELRPGRGPNGEYWPKALAAHYRQKAKEAIAHAAHLEQEAFRVEQEEVYGTTNAAARFP